jgi:hypothetical protein
MHVLALNKEDQWPYAEILLTTPGAFQEALNRVTIIEQQCIEYGLDSIKLDEIENFLLKAEKGSSIGRKDNEDNRPWSIVVAIDENGHLNMTGYSQIEKNNHFEFTIKYQNISKE